MLKRLDFPLKNYRVLINWYKFASSGNGTRKTKMKQKKKANYIIVPKIKYSHF